MKRLEREPTMLYTFYHFNGKPKLTLEYPIEDKVQVVCYFPSGAVNGYELLTVEQLTTVIEHVRQTRETVLTRAPKTCSE